MTFASLTSPSAFARPDYKDRFELSAAEPFESLDHFVRRLVTSQPGWLTRVSMGISGSAKLERATNDALSGRTEGIGNWKILEAAEHSITLGEDMKIMRYRLVYELTSPTSVSATTEVAQQTRWFGPIYWWLASRMHVRFLPLMLRNAGGEGATTTQLE